jgi:hypothetical protein
MILIDKHGVLYAHDEQIGSKYRIEDKEVLSFLRNSISGISSSFGVRDFIAMFENYPSLSLIVPEFEEVIELSKKYHTYADVDVESLLMQISSDIVAREDEENSSMYFSLTGVSKLKENFSLNVQASDLALKNVINAKIKIMDSLAITFEVGDNNSYKGHVPFSIKNFTFFDFFAVVANSLVQNSQNDDLEDSFKDIKEKLFNIGDSMSEKLGLPNLESERKVDDEDVKENTDNILKQIQDMLNPGSDGNDDKEKQ